MALSGSISTNVSAHWRLSISWTATQDSSANKSTITAKMYWEDRDGYGAISSTTTKSGAIEINGTKYTFSGSGLAGLKANQKKLISTETRTITHNSDGTATFSLDGYFDADVSLNSYVGRIDLDQKSFTLNTIPRESTLSSSPSWTAGSDKTVTVNRSSSSFNHEVEISVKNTAGDWIWISRVVLSSSETSGSTSFTNANNNLIFQTLAGRASTASRMVVQTFSGSTMIGEVEHLGTCTSPESSVVGKINSSDSRDLYLDQATVITVSRENSDFTHTVEISAGTFKKTFTSVGSSTSWTPTESERTQIYAQAPNSNTIAGNIRITTYYGTQIVRSATNTVITFYVVNRSPIFSASSVSYADTDSAIVAVTGSNAYIVQNKSTLTVSINSPAVGQEGATITEYVVTAGNLSGKRTGVGAVTLGALDSSSNITLSVMAVDSRGNSTTVTKQISVIPYSAPSINLTAERVNGFENLTDITVKGSFSPISVAGVNKNSITYVYRRQKESNFTTYGSNTSLTVTQSPPSYSVAKTQISLDNLKAWDVLIEVKDRISTAVTTIKRVPVGQPILFIDSVKKSVGINKFPVNAGTFEVQGTLHATLLKSSGDIEAVGKVSGSSVQALGAMTAGVVNSEEINATINLNARNANVTNLATLIGGAEMLRFEMSTHAYMAWWLNGTRQAYFGFPSASAQHMNIYNQKLDKTLAISDKLLWNSKEVLSGENVEVGNGSSAMTGNTPKAINITFKTPFPTIPKVMATMETTVPGYHTSNPPWVSGIAVFNIKTTGFTMYITRTNDSVTSYQWMAICL